MLCFLFVERADEYFCCFIQVAQLRPRQRVKSASVQPTGRARVSRSLLDSPLHLMRVLVPRLDRLRNTLPLQSRTWTIHLRVLAGVVIGVCWTRLGTDSIQMKLEGPILI